MLLGSNGMSFEQNKKYLQSGKDTKIYHYFGVVKVYILYH